MKKAVIVTLTVKARVIVEDTDSEEKMVAKAVEKIKRNVGDYIHDGNLEDVCDDTEVPYNPQTDKPDYGRKRVVRCGQKKYVVEVPRLLESEKVLDVYTVDTDNNGYIVPGDYVGMIEGDMWDTDMEISLAIMKLLDSLM